MPASAEDAPPPRSPDALEDLAYASLLPGAVAAGLVLASGLAVAPDADALALGRLAVLAFCGTVAVYNVDRLRDQARDREDSPRRTAFIARHARRLRGLAIGCAALCIPLAAGLPLASLGLLGAVMAIGLMHRRLKGRPGIKVAYVTFAWMAVTIGLPLLTLGSDATERHVPAFVIGVLGAALAANLMVSDLRDDARVSRAGRLGVARALLLGAIAVALAGPSRLTGLGLVPLGQLASLIRFRDDERFGLVAVDGSLLLGAWAAALVLFLRTLSH